MRFRNALYITVLLTLVSTARASAGTVIRFTDASVEPGDTFSVDVVLENETSIGGFNIPFRWSTSDLQFLGSEFVTDRFAGQYAAFNKVVDPDLRLGGILFITTSDSSATRAAIFPGVGSIARLHFRASQSASSQYALVDSANAYTPSGYLIAKVDLSDPLGTLIPFVTTPGVITVGTPSTVAIDLAPTLLSFRASPSNPAPRGKSFDVTSAGLIEFPWTATWSSTWLSVSPPFGKTPAFPTASVDAFALGYGEYRDTIWLSSPYATNSPVPLTVRLVVDTASAPPPTNGFALYQCRPSPFVTYHDPQTEIPFNLVDADHVTLTIYDALGRRVRALVSQPYSEGDHSVSWDGRDERGVVVASGRYFCRMVTSRGSQARPLIVIK